MLEPHSTAEGKLVLVFVTFVSYTMRSSAAISKGFVLRHIDVLNRFSDHANQAHTAHIMKYIFPRQFGLHNVFTSRTDSRETTQPLKDYTLREEEIEQIDHARHIAGLSTAHLPKRLRGFCFALIQRLQTLHDRCSYSQLLAHHCPSPVSHVMLLARGLSIDSCSFCQR